MFTDDKAVGESRRVLDPAGQMLAKAADLIEEKGHAKWTLYDANGGMCILGALSSVFQLGRNYDAYKEAEDRLEEHLGMTICSWNNDPERTQAQVVYALRQAAYKVP